MNVCSDIAFSSDKCKMSLNGFLTFNPACTFQLQLTLSLFNCLTQAEVGCCRYAVGSVLSQDEEKPDEELQRQYEKFGFRVISFPEVSCAVTSSFPNQCMLSPLCGAYRVFPELHSYITVSK